MTVQAAPLEATIEIDAPPAKVWTLVSDPRNMRKFSPQVLRTLVPGGPRLGAKMYNLNHKGLLVWPTRAKIVAFEPLHKIAFRITENLTVWSYTLEPTDAGGTRLIHRREADRGISDLSVKLQKTVMGGLDEFTEHLHAGMQQTLARIKQAAEAS